IVALPATNAVNVSPTSASCTLSVPVTGSSVDGGMYPAEMLSISNAFELLASTTLLNECRPVNSTYPFEANERSEEHTSELQSLMRLSSAAFCLTKKKTT